MTRLAFAGLVLAITGCAASPGDDDNHGGPGPGNDPGNGSGSGSGSGSGGGGASISPRTGGWIYGEQTPVSSTCSTSTPRGEAGPFAIDQVTNAGFRIVPNDGTPPFTCSSSGATFRCPDRATLVMDYRPGLDAVVTVHGTATGTFSDTGHATGRQDATVTCSGAQCAVIGPLPCGFKVDFAIRAR